VPRASRTRAHSLAEVIRTVHLRETRGARLGSSPPRPSQLLRSRTSLFQPRVAKCRGHPGLGPQYCRGDQNRPSEETRGARLGSSPPRPSQLQSARINSFHSRSAESALKNKHRVTARGHLGVIERAAQRAEASGLAAEGITVFSRCQFNLISILVPARSE
jgi:hypothetical protein